VLSNRKVPSGTDGEGFMWADNETSRDFLNFSGVSETVAEIIVQAAGRPISIGVSGAWGVGKSSMIQLIRSSLANRSQAPASQEFVIVEFNAWLYQGYDDARAALMDVIASKLSEEAEKRKTATDRVAELVKRVRWFRVAKIAAGGAAMAFGLPPLGLVGDAINLAKGVAADGVTQDVVNEATRTATALQAATNGMLAPQEAVSPPKEIQALRDNFEQILEELGVTLVVLIDDLDRCLPDTTISTLEAIRLFLFLERTAFVIAADTEMIKHAVRKHFEGVNDNVLVTNYFDKLIQIPIQVPALGVQEVRSYLLLLFVENSNLDAKDKEEIREAVIRQLSLSWKGERVDRAFLETLGKDFPSELISRLDTAERLAPLMARASGISGNPRLIKRFLNALFIRMTIAKAQGVGVDEAVLAKLLLFERLGDSKAYASLISEAGRSDGGKVSFLADWEQNAAAGKQLDLEAPWDDPFVEEWLRLPPALSNLDLRGALYVGREHAPFVSPEDRLSSDAADLLEGLLTTPEMASSMKDRLTEIPRVDMSIMMDRLLDKARQEQSWGVPGILEACLALSEADPVQGGRLLAFLKDRPHAQIQPDIVPKLSGMPWSRDLFDSWSSSNVSGPVKKAIKQQGK